MFNTHLYKSKLNKLSSDLHLNVTHFKYKPANCLSLLKFSWFSSVLTVECCVLWTGYHYFIPKWAGWHSSNTLCFHL